MMTMVVYNPSGFACERDFTGSDGTSYQRGDLVPAAKLYAERNRDVLLTKRYAVALLDMSCRRGDNWPGERHSPCHLPVDPRIYDATPYAPERTYLTRPEQSWPAFDGSEVVL